MKFLIISAIISAMSLQAAPLPSGSKELARNNVMARYVKTESRPCMHRTSLCPDRCGHAKNVAVFEVLRNDGYSKSGEYGDPKAIAGSMIYVDVDRDVEGQSPAVIDFIKTLRKSAMVQMTQVHYYVTKNQTSYPVRPIVELKPRLTCSVPPSQ